MVECYIILHGHSWLSVILSCMDTHDGLLYTLAWTLMVDIIILHDFVTAFLHGQSKIFFFPTKCI